MTHPHPGLKVQVNITKDLNLILLTDSISEHSLHMQKGASLGSQPQRFTLE